jgi:uncharacterized protein YbaR (Trm112 family)
MTPKCPGCKEFFVGVNTRSENADGKPVILVCCPQCQTVLGVVSA